LAIPLTEEDDSFMTENKNNEKEIPVEFTEERSTNTPAADEETHPENAEAAEHHSRKGRKAKEDHKKKMEEVQKKYDDLHEQYLRHLAEFSNYKKRIDREQLELADYVKGEIIKKFLPILDDFDRMLKISNGEVNKDSLLAGAKLISDKFNQILNEFGVQKIEAIGQDFNPQIHEAMLLQKVEDAEKNGKILSVFQDGYLLKEKLLRASKVVIGQCEQTEAKN
jgi:molecular chaperone GrpE